MASVVEDESEYESDPEESKMSLIARRREASDDEDEEDERDERDMGERVERDGKEMRERVERLSESESEGAVEEYDDESEEFDEEEVERDEEVELEERESEVKVVGGGDEEFLGEKEAVELEEGGEEVVGEEKNEKKENEPFAVPTAGAFYMHDDRFRDGSGGRGGGGGRQRRNLGGRNLWESKDDRKWGHDKFEEMSTQERHYGEGRKASRGRNRGRGKIQGEERGYARSSRPKTFNNGNQNNVPNNQNSRLQNNSPKNPNSAPKNPNNVPKGVRGRGPRRYQSYWNEVSVQNKQHGKSADRGHYATSAKVSERPLTVESDQISAKRHVSSSLNHAAPPFYSSASSKKEISATQRRDGPAAPLHRDLQSSVTDESFSRSAEKNLADVVGMNKLYIDNPAPTHTGKPLNSSQLQVSVSSWTNSSQYPHSRVQGRVQTPVEKMAYQPTPQNQVNRVSNPSQHRNGQQAPTQTRQGSFQTSGRQSGQQIQASLSPDSALTTNAFEFRETKSPQESSKSNTALIGKGKSVEGNGRGSFSYGGAQVIGASGGLASSHGDVNFPGMPTFLPVMQFGGQHPGGIGVPAVGMAFPGYVNNPGSGNSEMTWLPVLAGPAGALGASYNSSYLSVDGTYHSRPSSQVSSLAGASSKENNVNKTSNGLMPSQKQEIVTDEFGPRQNKPRRYTEMKFDQ